MSISLNDIATQLGVSVSTVSKAINNRPGVSDEVRKKILDTLKEMNYEPKQTAKGLVSKDSSSINVCIKTNCSIMTDPFYASILEGVSNELQLQKYNLVLNIFQDDEITQEQFDSVFVNIKLRRKYPYRFFFH